MDERYVVFDVETPNYGNNRMSAIGITIVENGVITEEFFSLVNPETHFDAFNTALTGINSQMVQNAPTFDSLWQYVRQYFDCGVLVAHNATFDMCVLSKCLKAYNIQWKQRALYACTVQMGRACYPNAPNHKLNTLCDYLGIDLKHHQADSDSSAAAKLLIDYINNGIDVSKFIRSYDLCK